MTTLTPTRPSNLLHGIQLQTIGRSILFQFTDDLQQRLETLLDRQKANQLNPEETTELEAIGELDRIFTHINALLLAQSCP